MAVYIATWTHIDSAADGGLYPQVGGLAAEQRVQDIYWRCVYVFFSLAQRFFRSHSDIRLQFFTNVKTLPVVDDTDIGAHLADLGVQVIQRDYTWRPSGNRKVWYNQYYLFDILGYWAVSGARGDYYIVCDCDCVFVRDPSTLLQQLVRDSILLINVDTQPDENINGITRRQAALVYRDFGVEPQVEVAPYYGGEFYGLSHAKLEQFMQHCDRLFRANNERATVGQTYLSDEAHLFSLIMLLLGHATANGDCYFRRIWTGQRVNNTRASDLDLTVWHIPSEKSYGLKTVFDGLRRAPDRLSILSNSGIRSWLAPKLGVGRIYPHKFMGHSARALARKFQGAWQAVSRAAS